MVNSYPESGHNMDAILDGGQLVDLSTDVDVASYTAIPFAGVIVDAYACLSATLATADNVITVKVIKGGTTTTIGTITQAYDGSAAGDVDRMVVTGSLADRSVNRGDTLVFSSGGESTNTAIGTFCAVLRRT